MADQLNNHDVLWDPPIVSGCFMLFRTDVLQQLEGFDPRFFLYFEDFDISLRAGRVSRIAYVPQVKVVHHGGHASRKGWRHIWMFGRSGDFSSIFTVGVGGNVRYQKYSLGSRRQRICCKGGLWNAPAGLGVNIERCGAKSHFA